MEPMDVMACLERAGAILRNDHFVYASGLHGDTYIAKKMLYTDASVTALLCRQMAQRALEFGRITCVVGPEKGGIILAQWVGYFLNEALEYKVASVFAEKTDVPTYSPAHWPRFIFSDDYGRLVKDKDVLLVDDVVTTGGSLGSLACLVRQYGGKIRGGVALYNRGNVAASDIGIPGLVSLVNMSEESWPAHQCLLCVNKVPVNLHYGRGREFIMRGVVEDIQQHMGSMWEL